MRLALRAVTCVLLLAAVLLAEPVKFRYFREVAKTSAAEVITLQVPARSNRSIRLLEVMVKCDVDVTVTFERDGSSATSTAATPFAINRASATSVATINHTSPTTVGTVIDKYDLYGGDTLLLQPTDILISAENSAFKNFTVRTSAFTGTVRIRLTWQEE